MICVRDGMEWNGRGRCGALLLPRIRRVSAAFGVGTVQAGHAAIHQHHSLRVAFHAQAGAGGKVGLALLLLSALWLFYIGLTHFPALLLEKVLLVPVAFALDQANVLHVVLDGVAYLGHD